jgi:hypothetical protein
MNIEVKITEGDSIIQAFTLKNIDDVILALQTFQYEYDAQQDAKTHDNN